MACLPSYKRPLVRCILVVVMGIRPAAGAQIDEIGHSKGEHRPISSKPAVPSASSPMIAVPVTRPHHAAPPPAYIAGTTPGAVVLAVIVTRLRLWP